VCRPSQKSSPIGESLKARPRHRGWLFVTGELSLRSEATYLGRLHEEVSGTHREIPRAPKLPQILLWDKPPRNTPPEPRR
jgi:hypothetical protein